MDSADGSDNWHKVKYYSSSAAAVVTDLVAAAAMRGADYAYYTSFSGIR